MRDKDNHIRLIPFWIKESFINCNKIHFIPIISTIPIKLLTILNMPTLTINHHFSSVNSPFIPPFLSFIITSNLKELFLYLSLPSLSPKKQVTSYYISLLTKIIYHYNYNSILDANFHNIQYYFNYFQSNFFNKLYIFTTDFSTKF